MTGISRKRQKNNTCTITKDNPIARITRKRQKIIHAQGTSTKYDRVIRHLIANPLITNVNHMAGIATIKKRACNYSLGIK
jgi:hypothetical protein